ncbi:MAG: ABC transporter ATP-binding protein [Candidatus Didemnitutus sp.]|nr:ABC transporter ATP-binding protein [Candidatus Didemnitutus sp.]
MDSETLISARNLSKAYRIWSDPAQRLLGPLLAEAARWVPGSAGESLRKKAHAAYRDFYALHDVSFELRRGEAIGIVGRNGAGKSTLLQLIAGTLQPSAGEIQVRGRVAALLELGAGFNPDFTGRENVFLSGAVLGLSKAEMEKRFDSVAAFADIGEFIEQPVKTYSSGMMMRLAFAVNTCVDPEILIVDEALSVGDAPFQAKCFRRLRQLIENGVSLLFVSHDLGTVRSICSRALWLKNGRAEMWGEAKEVAKAYEKFCWAEQGVTLGEPLTAAEKAPTSAAPSGGELALPPGAGEGRYGTHQMEIRGVALELCNGTPVPDHKFDFGAEVRLRFAIEARTAFKGKIRVGVRVKTARQDVVLTISNLDGSASVNLQSGHRLEARYEFKLPLAHGHYTLMAALFAITPLSEEHAEVYTFSNATILDCMENLIAFEMRPRHPIPAVGPVHTNCPLEISLHSPAGASQS